MGGVGCRWNVGRVRRGWLPLAWPTRGDGNEVAHQLMARTGTELPSRTDSSTLPPCGARVCIRLWIHAFSPSLSLSLSLSFSLHVAFR